MPRNRSPISASTDSLQERHSIHGNRWKRWAGFIHPRLVHHLYDIVPSLVHCNIERMVLSEQPRDHFAGGNFGVSQPSFVHPSAKIFLQMKKHSSQILHLIRPAKWRLLLDSSNIVAAEIIGSLSTLTMFCSKADRAIRGFASSCLIS